MCSSDLKGCPKISVERETEMIDTGMIRLGDVNFETNSSVLPDSSKRSLDEAGVILAHWPQLRIEIGGHTDDIGNDQANQTLSEARAESVRAYLVARFPDIDPKQFTTKGYGRSKPLTRTATEDARAKNRRVELKVLNREILKQEIAKRAPAAAPADSTKK